MSTALDWLAADIARLDAMFGPISIPHGATLRPTKSGKGAGRGSEWNLRFAIGGPTRRADVFLVRRSNGVRIAPRRTQEFDGFVWRDAVVPPRLVRGGQAAVDLVQRWVFGGAW